MNLWAIFSEDGTSFRQVYSENHPCDPTPQGGHPSFNGDRSLVVALDRKGDPAIEDLQPDGTWSLNLEKYKGRLLRALDAERSKRLMDGAEKRYAHFRKGTEATLLLTLSTQDLEALSHDDLVNRYPWLQEEAEQRGEDIAVTAARVHSAMMADEDRLRTNEAIAVAAKARIAEAASREEADAEAAVEWSD
jgi:hypothetical protein